VLILSTRIPDYDLKKVSQLRKSSVDFIYQSTEKPATRFMGKAGLILQCVLRSMMSSFHNQDKSASNE